MRMLPKIDFDRYSSPNKYRTVIYVLSLIVLIVAGALCILIARSMSQGTIQRDALYSIGIVLCTSSAFRILNDLFVKDIDAKRIESSLHKILHENTVGNRVRVFFNQPEIDSFQDLLTGATNDVICCGTSLINIAHQAYIVEDKLAAMPKFKAEFILMDPSTELYLIEKYIENTNEDDFLPHLVRSYNILLRLRTKYPNNVEVYLYHTLPLFSCLVSDGKTSRAKMNLSFYLHGRYPPYSPGMQLDASNPAEGKMIREYMESLDSLKLLSKRLLANEDTKEYWNMRAASFDSLTYVKNPKLTEEFIRAAHISQEHQILEIGAGTGVLASLIASQVRHYIGIDTSPDMLTIANGKHIGKAVFVHEDLRHLPFGNERFDRVLARMVLHHVTHGLLEALGESFRVLKKGGKLIICENVPNDPQVMDFFKECFEIKEDRLSFQIQDLRDLLENAEFRIDTEPTELLIRTSLENWLNNNGLGQTQIDSIREKFMNMPDRYKVYYGYKKMNGDITFDAKFVIFCVTKEA